MTLLHSRSQLLPTFVKAMHDEIVSTLDGLHIDTILGDRLDLTSVKEGKTVTTPDGRKERVVRTVSGREVRAELIVSRTATSHRRECTHFLSSASVHRPGTKYGAPCRGDPRLYYHRGPEEGPGSRRADDASRHPSIVAEDERQLSH